MSTPYGYQVPDYNDFLVTIERLAEYGEVELADPCSCCKKSPMVIFTRREMTQLRIDAYCVFCDAMHLWPITEFGPEDFDDMCEECPECHGCVTHGGCDCERCGECWETREGCECLEGFLEEEEE